MGDENIGIIGKVFVGNKGAEQIIFEVQTGAKTYMELHGLAESMKAQMQLFEAHTLPINAKIQVFSTTRIIVSKLPGSDAIVREFN